MKVVSLFTGAGGLDLGLHQAGHEIILQCECDPGAQQVLRKAFPGTLLVPDVCALQRLPKETELVAAGFPCIDVSRAGLRQGLDGAATGLVRHVFRLLGAARDDARPVPWVLLENVEALTDRCHGGPPLVAWVASQLEGLGYRSWAHRVVCSAGFGVPNRRRRIFILASWSGDARDVLLGQGLMRCMGGCLSAVGGDCYECFNPDDDPTTGARREAAMLRCSYALDLGNARSSAGVDVVPTFTTSNARICLLLSNGRYGGLRIEDAERLQGLPVGHTAPCYPVSAPGIKQHRTNAVRDSDADAAARARFALLGNAVTVQVAEWLGHRLADPYAFKYHVNDNDMPLPKFYQPPGMTDRDWELLREVRQDQLRASGAASGTAKLVQRPNPWSAPQPDGAAGNTPEAAAVPGPASGATSVVAAEEPVDAVVLTMGSEPGLAVAAAGDFDDEAMEEEDEQEQEQQQQEQQQEQQQARAQPAEPGSGADGAGTSAPPAAEGAAGAKVARRAYRSRPPTSWPRAAWFLAGHGRWGLRDASDAPVKSRFVPLGEFISRVGPPPSDVALVTYLARLKEQGWNVDRTERKMLMCGVPGLAGEGGGAGQGGLTGMLGGPDNDPSSAASSIGRLVWAAHTSSQRRAGASAPAGGAGPAQLDVLWPCEAVDPFNPPRGFKLLPEHRLGLTVTERKLYLPCGSGSDADAAMTDAEPQQQQQQQPVAGGGAGGDVGASPTPPPGSRKLLLVWFHTNQFEWRHEDELLSWEPHRRRIKGEVAALIASGRMSRPQEWRRAYHEAKHCATIIARATKVAQRQQQLEGVAGPAAAVLAAAALSSDDSDASSDLDGEEGERGARSALAGRAAKQAAAVNLKMPRCKVCETCTQSTGSSSRRCLLVRATAAAAAGHAGAQLAVLGEKAVGADVEVWWPLDQAWYKGVLSAYDALRVRHTINYADGDVEIIPLWAPQQRIKLLSQPAAWVAKAAQLAADKAAVLRGVEAARAAARVAGAGALPEAVPELTVLEQERAGNIARNKQVLEAYMAQEAAVAAAAAAAAVPAGEGECGGAALDPPTPAGAGGALVAKPDKSVGSLTSVEAGAPAAKRGAKKAGHKRARPPAPAVACINGSSQQAAAAHDGAKDAAMAAAAVTDDEWQRALAIVAKRQAAGAAEARIRAQAAILQSTKGPTTSKKARKAGSSGGQLGAGGAPAADA